MITVKPLNDSNWQHLPKRQFRSWIKNYIPVLLFSSLLGTYLDLIMVGKQLYSFPHRPFPAIFSINLLFTLVVLPSSTLLCLFLIIKRTRWMMKAAIIIFISLGMAVLEKKSEELGLFAHSHAWSHCYTFIGYCLYLMAVNWFHAWITRRYKY